MIGRILWKSGKLVTKYVVLPIAISVATAMVADRLTERMRERTAALEGRQTRLDIDPTLHPAP